MKYINISEKYGDRTEASIHDYKKQLEIFEDLDATITADEHGIYINRECVAEPILTVAALQEAAARA